jgi:uncharacterized membrane protein YgdD (TMEM256/DUF423 family)
MKIFVAIGALLMIIGVGAGAFGAHGLSSYFSRFPNLEGTYETAVRYHIYHALGILFVAWAAVQWPGALTSWAGYLMLAGVIIFSGSLYLLVFTRMSWLGAITPIGGVALLAGWACLFIAAWRQV